MSNEYDDIISAEPGPKANEYDALLQTQGDEKRQALRSSIISTGDTNPDEAAKALQLSKRTGVPAPVVERNMPVVEKNAQLNEYDQLLNTAPVTASALSDPAFARIAKDDAGNMVDIEHTMKPPPAKPVVNAVEYSQMVQKAMKDNAIDADTARTLVSSHVQVNDTDPMLGQSRPGGPAADIGNTIEGLWKSLTTGGEQVRQGIRAQFADALGLQDMSADAIHKWATAQLTQQVTTPKYDTYGAQLVYGGAANVLQNAPILAAAIMTGNPEIAAALGALQQQTQSYGKYRERGATGAQAELGASIEGAIEFATERIPLKFLTEKFGKIPTWQLFVGDQAREQITEQIATHTQDLTDALIANPDMTIAQYLAARPDAALQTAVAVLMQGMVVSTAHKAAIAMAGKSEASMRAQVDAERMDRLFKLTQASKVMERDPSSFANFVQAAADQGQMSDIHVDARTFAQAAGEKLNDIVQASPSVATQLEAALKSGGDMIIPTGEYATKIAPLDSSGALMEHLRVGSDEFSQAEAKTFMQGQVEEFNKQAQEVLEEKQFDAAFRESAASVENELLTQLNAAGRFTTDVNAVYAKIAAAYYTVTAAKRGMTPEQMYVEYPLHTQASPLVGGKMHAQDGGALAAWLRNSFARTPDGKPLVLYRGEHGKTTGSNAAGRSEGGTEPTTVPRTSREEIGNAPTQFQTRGGAISFGTKEVANTYAMQPNDSRDTAEAPRVMPVYLKIERPIVNDPHDPFIELSTIATALGEKEAKRIAIKFADQIENTNNWQDDLGKRYKSVREMLKKDPAALSKLFFSVHEYLDDPKEIAKLKAAGFDGAIHQGSGASLDSAEYKVFDESQVKSAIGNRGTFDPSSRNTLEQGARNAQGQDQNNLDFTGPTAQSAELHTTVGGGHAEQGWAESTGIRRTNGEVATVYRGAGTPLAPEHFDVQSLGASSGNPSSGLGVWFTNDRTEAVTYGEPEGFYLDVRNPLTVRVEDLPGFDSVEQAHAWREQQRAEGYDGLIITAAHLGGRTHVVAFEPNQVIIPNQKTFNQETIDNESGALDEQPTFFSVLFRQIENSQLKEAPVAKWRALINNLGSKGVKKEEVVTSGIMDWLDMREQESKPKPDMWQLLDDKGDVVSVFTGAAKEAWEQSSDSGHETSMVPYEPPKDRVTKEEVLDYMSKNGKTVETLLLGEPPKPKPVKKTEVAVPTVDLPPGFGIEENPGNGAMVFRVTTPNGRVATGATRERAIERAIALHEEEPTDLPDDYEVRPNEDGFNDTFDLFDPDGEEVGRYDTFAEAREEAYVHASRREAEEEHYPTEDRIEQRAEELWNDRDTSHYYDWARESDWVQFNDPHLVLPNARVVEDRNHDLFRGEPGWRIEHIVYPNADEINRRDGDVDDLDPPEYATQEQVFRTREAAIDALNQDGVNGEPWIEDDPHFIAEFTDHDDDTTDQHSTYRDAERDAEQMQDRYVQQEAESLAEDDSFGDDGDTEHWMDEARRELENDFEEEVEHAERQARRFARGENMTSHRPSTPPDPNRPRWAGQYQSDGGAQYREAVLTVPGIEPYNEHDDIHYGPRGKGRAVVWGRFKVHIDANGVATLYIEEDQSQRGQHLRKQGLLRAEYAGLEKERDTLAAEYAALDAKLGDEVAAGGTSQTPVDPDLRPQMHTLSNSINELDSKMRELKRDALFDAVIPPAPFVGDTKAWATLGMKAMLRWAVDNNITQVAWTVGAQNAKRYGTSDHIDSLKWEKIAEGIHVHGIKDGRVVLDKVLNDNDSLREHIEGAAKKIIDDPAQSGEMSAEELDSLAINGLGMQAFYGDADGIGPKGDPAMMTIVANGIIKDLLGKEKAEQNKVGRMDLTVTEKGRTYAGAPGFKITPEMAEKIKGGFALFQENRGQMTFGNTLGQGSTMSLLEHADLSTFFHELGHFMLEVQMDIATQPNAPQEIKDDVDKLLRWFGVPGVDVWRGMSLEEQRPYHEQFARGFEAYLFEGKSPNIELSDTFARIRAWFINVYRALTGLKVDLTDEVRGVMDRLIASNEQIMAAEQARSYAPMFKSAEEMGATPEEWKAYQELSYAATQEAVSELDARSLRDMQWLNNARTGELRRLQKDAKAKRAAVEAEVTAEVRAKPEYAVQRFLKNGELPEADRNREQRRIAEEAALQGTKLNLGDLKEMYGEGPAAPWRYLPTGPHGMVTAKDGMHPELVSQLFGFKSADEMIRTILNAQPEANVIEGMTDQRTLERYGDLTDQTRRNRAANEAVHNTLRARVIATELRALDKATNPRQDTGRVNAKGNKISLAVLPKAAREFANTIIARKKIRDVKPAQFEAAEARNARAAMTKTDLVERATEKRNQLVNNYAAKAAYAALDEIDKAVADFKRYDNKGTIKALSRDYLDQIYAILDRYDMRKLPLNTAAKRQSLLEWVKDQEEQGFAPTIDKNILDEARRIPYKELTVEEFRGMRDAIKNIEHLARLKQKLLTSKDQREFREAADNLAGSIIGNAPKTIPPRRSSDHGLGVSVKSLFNTFTAIHRKFASFAREMDGWKDGGAAWELLVRGMNEKGTFEEVENVKATRAIIPMLDPVIKQWGRRLTRRQDFNGKSYSPEERISLLLNMGNDTNMERVTTGEGLTPDQLQNIVAHLTPADVKFVNDVWAYLDSFRDQIGAKELRVNGVAPEWVEARPFQLKLITGEVVDMRGGYYPIAYDPLLNEKAAAGSEADVYKQMSQGRYARAQTRRGHLESRVESTGRPLRFDFAQVLANHVSQVIHDLAWHEYMIDANRLMRDSAIENAMRNHYGVEVIKEMKDTLRDITIGPLNVDKGSQFLNYIRYGTTISGLALNVFNSLQNMTGITQSFARVGSGWMLKGMAHWAGDTLTLQNSMKKVYAMSPMMEQRARTGGNRELSELKGKVAGEFDDSKLMAVYWYLNNKTQQIVDIPTWWGAYEKAMAQENMDESKAIALADQAVLDAQGGGQLKDLSGIQRGGAGLKLLTTFYGFFNTTYNLTAESYGRTDFKKPGDVLIFGADMLLLYAIPALLSSLLKGWLQDDLEKKRLMKRVIADQLNYMVGTMVGLREINAGLQAATGMSTMGYTGPAGTRIFNDLYQLGVQVHQGRLDENFWKALNNTMGILLHYPAGQLNRIAEALVQYNDGKTNNPGILIAGPKPKK